MLIIKYPNFVEKSRNFTGKLVITSISQAAGSVKWRW